MNEEIQSAESILTLEQKLERTKEELLNKISGSMFMDDSEKTLDYTKAFSMLYELPVISELTDNNIIQAVIKHVNSNHTLRDSIEYN